MRAHSRMMEPVRSLQQPESAARGTTARVPSGAPSGRRPDAFYRVVVGAALLHLDDRAALECNALAQLPGVTRLADQRYPAAIWRRGLCLRDLLTRVVDDTLEAAGGDDLAPLRKVLQRVSEGDTLTAIARDLGMHRESLSRGLWSRIRALVWDRLKAELAALEMSGAEERSARRI